MPEDMLDIRLSRARLYAEQILRGGLDPESLDIEIKRFSKMDDTPFVACIAKEVIALANSGGGYVFIGFSRESQTAPYTQDLIEQQDLDTWEQTRLNQALQRFLSLPIEVRLAKLPENSPQYVVLIVSSITTLPVSCIRNCENSIHRGRVYIRKPGPISEEPFTAEEWRRLLTGCLKNQGEELVGMIRNVIMGVEVKPSQSENLDVFVQASDTGFAEMLRNNQASLPATKFGRWVFTSAPTIPLEREMSLTEVLNAAKASVSHSA